ncbi:MAG: chromosomal replication initiator protein DnaA [Anaerolineales bacterium]|nr:chromosomal replication initiator protein DnaA [Anaerolineales bacterium]
MEGKQAWQAALGQLQLEMPKAAFDTWVRDAELISATDGNFQIGVHNAYARDWLDSRLKSTITKLLNGTMNRPVDITFVINNVAKKHTPQEQSELLDSPLVEIPRIENSPPQRVSINLRYNFNNFVVGSSNRLAHAASLAVAEKPAQTYNPLFLYGGVGLGKTHLLHAIGNMGQVQGLEVLYVSSEEFTNDLIMAIRNHTTQAFREKYRRIDILLIDDIQFIAGKESTQEEFFHTFNTLHGQNKQIVMTSDRPPKAMVTLEERLRNRFEWGLAADIQPPDFETRVAILQSKAQRMGFDMPDSILENIAQRFQTNIRELEGAMTRLRAYADLRGMVLDEKLVEYALADLMPETKEIEPEQILNTIAQEYGISMEDLLSHSRSQRVSFPRQVAMYMLREESELSLPKIGELLGGRDHTTVMYGHDKITDLLERDKNLRRKIVNIQEILYSPVSATV